MWTTQRTWTTGDKVTASLLNVQLRDDLNFLYSPPRCRLGADSSWTMTIHKSTVSAPVTTNILSFPKVFFDNFGMFDSERPTRITSAKAGDYTLFGCVLWLGIDISGRCEIYWNGTGFFIATSCEDTLNSSFEQSVATDQRMALDEFVELNVAFGSSGGVDSDTKGLAGIGDGITPSHAPQFYAHWIGGS